MNSREYHPKARTCPRTYGLNTLLSFFFNLNNEYANTEKHGAVDQRSAGSLALTLTVKTRLWDINETCLQGLNLSSYKVSELSNDLALLQHVMNAVGLCKSLREAQAGSALVNGVAGLFGQKTNFDFGQDARNELIFWIVCTCVCTWIALRPRRADIINSN